MSEGKAQGGLDPDAALGAAIAHFRRRAQLSPAELGGRASLDASRIVAIEAGQLEPAWGELRRLAHALEVGLPELLEEAERRADRWDR
jgi:ribosome-binding protein aMBF1 (putative translation factor)